MKRLLLLPLALLSVGWVQAIDFDRDEFYFPTDIEEGIVVTKTELVYVVADLVSLKVKSRTPRPPVLTNSFGYLEITTPGLKVTGIDLNGSLVQQLSVSVPLAEAKTWGINEDARVSASSYLVEKIRGANVEYRPETVLKRLTREKEVGEYLFGNTVPWVPDRTDTKPSLTVTAASEVTSFLILAGFVDTARQALFYDNQRPKTLRITDVKTQRDLGTFTLNDTTHYQKVSLKEKSASFQITVVDTYPGKKYQDLCITSIVLDPSYTGGGDFQKAYRDEVRKELGF